jgi:hypothetical protein
VNTQAAKVAGFRVFVVPTGIEVFAVGDADGDIWRFATGATAYTPV